MLMVLTLLGLGEESLGTTIVRTPFSTWALIWSSFTFSGNSISREKSPLPPPLSATCQTPSLSFPWDSFFPAPSALTTKMFPSSTSTFISSLLGTWNVDLEYVRIGGF
ncbi:hypothetical protein RHGRI_022469 [Rhododendron griersonianum]|uniref:Secreted protein n=1 Tax=Rhododendron griersonianum TaxID=479676 RepID=A0AAV6J4H1_9ERIC|nr:hypothetical protein RHGRI_022469 [Rhododendron griersonianum]